MKFAPPIRQAILWACLRNDGISIVMIVAVIIQAALGLSLRGLYADGASFVNHFASWPAFFVPTPSRWTPVAIYEIPVLAAIHLGFNSLQEIALSFSVSTNVMPGAIFLLCRVALSQADRRYFIFPAFVYFAAVLATQFASVSEGLVATSCAWLLFYLILFGELSRIRLGLILLLSISSICLCEEMSFLASVLIVAGWFRRREIAQPWRMVLDLSLVSLLASAVFEAYCVAYPYYPVQRAFVRSALEANSWLYSWNSSVNLPAALGVAACAAIAACIALPRISRAVALIFALGAFGFAIASFSLDMLTSPHAQFETRHHPAMLSLPLMIIALAARWYTAVLPRLASPGICAIVISLGVSNSLWHIQATAQWSEFLSNFRAVLSSGSGIIPAASLLQPPGRAALLAEKMTWSWTNPDMSIIALQRPCINSIVANAERPGFQPYKLEDLKTMPVIPGITYTYLLPREQRAAACPLEQP